MSTDMNMSVSPICVKDGERFAYVSFQEGERLAEGKIPDCKIVSNKGFTAEEVAQLEEYMILELKNLKKMAAGINVLDAFLKG